MKSINALISAKNISVIKNQKSILKNIDIQINKNDFVSIIGPNGDFSSLPDISKWILTIGMILGRLELFAILVLFLPSFWKN